MRPSHVLLALTALSAALAAQTNSMNSYQMWDQTTEFTSRGSNGGTPGHVAQMFQHGFSANLRRITRSQYVMQDQNQVTREPWNVGTTGLDQNALPDFKNLHTYGRNLLLPPNQSGIGAWRITHTGLAGTPHDIYDANQKNKPDSCASWTHAWQFIQQTNWTTDGLSVHMSQAAPWQNTRQCGGNSNGTAGHREIPRTDGTPLAQIIEELGWTGVANNPDPTFVNRSWRLVLWFKEPVLQGFSENAAYNNSGTNGPCPNPNAGYAAIDPNIADMGGQQPGRFDNPAWEVRSQAHASGVAVLLWSTTVFAGGGVPTPFGQLHLNLADPLFLVGPQAMPPLSGAGVSRLTLKLGAANSPFRKPAEQLGTWSAQAVVLSQGAGVALSSLWTMRTANLPAGFKAGKTTKGKPASIPHNARPVIMTIRNDGRGRIIVQPKRGSQNLGPASVVCERTAANIVLPAGTSTIEVRSPNNANANRSRETKFAYRIQ